MKLLIYISFFLLVVAVAAADTPPAIYINGMDDFGVTIDPVTYERGNNIYDTSVICLYDGIYNIQCGMSVTPIDSQQLSIVSQAYTHMYNYTSDQAWNVNFFEQFNGGPFAGFELGGKFSQSTLDRTNTMMSTDTTLIVTELTNGLFDLSLNIQIMTMNIYLIELMTNCVQADVIGDEVDFAYWLNKLFTEFKPGVIYTGTVGAKLHQETYIYNSYYHSFDPYVVQDSATATCSFASLFGADYNWDVSTFDKDIFQDNVDSYSAESLGGEYTSDMNLTQWNASASSNPSLIDYTVDLSLFWLQPILWPQFPPNSTRRILDTYIQTYTQYFAQNIHSGCTDPYGMNFNLGFNVDNSDLCYYEYVKTSAWGSKYSYDLLYSNTWPNQTDPSAPQNKSTNLLTEDLVCPISTSPQCHWFAYDYGFAPSTWEYSKTSQNIFCDCNGEAGDPRSVSFGGVYLENAKNPITGGFYCPRGMIDDAGWCYGHDAPSATFGGMFRYLAYDTLTFSDTPTYCFNPNSYTANCTCPPWAPIEMFVSTQSYDDGLYVKWAYNEYICMQKAAFLIGENVGETPKYIAPKLAIAPAPFYPSSSKAPMDHHFKTKYIYEIIVPAVVGLLCILCIGIIIGSYYCHRHCNKKHSGYNPLN